MAAENGVRVAGALVATVVGALLDGAAFAAAEMAATGAIGPLTVLPALIAMLGPHRVGERVKNKSLLDVDRSVPPSDD